MRTIVFDIKGPYGHFRKPYAPASPVTYPFPPPPTVLGMIGAIIGLGKEEYHEALGWETIRIGIRLLSPVSVYRTAVNLLNTKNTDKYFRPRAEKNPRIQIPYEFLREPAFRIYAADLPESEADKLADALRTGQTVFTPSLGLAQCLAEVEFVAEADAEINADAESTASVIPLEEGTKILYDPGHRYERVRVAAVMDPERIVRKYREAVVALDADRPVHAEDASIFRIENENIAFF